MPKKRKILAEMARKLDESARQAKRCENSQSSKFYSLAQI